MNILYLMTEPLGIGGVQSDMLALAKGLTAKGHQYYLATKEGEMLGEFERNGGQLIHLDFQYAGFRGMLKAAKELRRIIIEKKIDLVAPQSVRTALVAGLATRLMPFTYRLYSDNSGAKARRVPLVTTIHNIHNPIHFYYAGWLLRFFSDFVIFESHYERDRLMASGLPSRQSTVVHSGIDLERFSPLPPSDPLREQWGVDATKDILLGIVARLSEEKGHHYLFEALAIARKARPELKLMVVGDGPLHDEIHQSAADKGLTGCIIFTGTQRNVQEYLSIFDVFVLSSTRESFPLAAREAMAAGKAVIAPRIGGCAEVVDDGSSGFLFESANSQDLADKILAITDGDTYQLFGRSARARTEHLFSLSAWVDGDEKIYLAALESKLQA